MKTKQNLSLFISLLFCIPTLGQTLQGTVYDATTKKPVPDAFVYLDGTSVSTTTDLSGHFELKTYGVLSTQLIVHHLSYALYAIPNPFQSLPDTIYLQERDRELNEAVVTVDRFTRAQKIKAFKEQFLGNSKAGKSCEILNEDDIVVSYDMNTQTLTAFSYNPLMVVNHFLSYRIVFNLVDFRTVFFGGKIDYPNTRHSFYAVTSSFTDLSPINKTFHKRREELYEHSLSLFYKNLTHHTLEKAQYKIFKKQNQINPSQYFEIKDSLSLKYVLIKPDSDTNFQNTTTNSIFRVTSQADDPSIFFSINVLFKRRIQSEIYFYTNEFFADEYGNIDAIDKIIYTGHFGNLRAGDMLPLDYDPKAP